MNKNNYFFNEDSYILHQRPYMNTSAIVDFMTLNYGLLSVVAKGIRRKGSKNKGTLLPFNKLKISFSKKTDLGVLTNIESLAPHSFLKKESLMAGYYINELIIRLATRNDSNVELYNAYSFAISNLSNNIDPAKCVRIFEFNLLTAIGYGIDLTKEIATRKPVESNLYYKFEPENGLIATNRKSEDKNIFLGKNLISMANKDLNDLSVLRSAKRLLSIALNHQLGGRPLKTTYVLNNLYN